LFGGKHRRTRTGNDASAALGTPERTPPSPDQWHYEQGRLIERDGDACGIPTARVKANRQRFRIFMRKRKTEDRELAWREMNWWRPYNSPGTSRPMISGRDQRQRDHRDGTRDVRPLVRRPEKLRSALMKRATGGKTPMKNSEPSAAESGSESLIRNGLPSTTMRNCAEEYQFYSRKPECSAPTQKNR